MLAGGADDVLKSHKMKEKNDKSVMTKAEWGRRAWPIVLDPTHHSQTPEGQKEGWKRIIDARGD